MPVFNKPLFCLIAAPKPKSNDAAPVQISQREAITLRRKKHSIYRVRYYPQFQVPLGLKIYSPWIREDYCILNVLISAQNAPASCLSSNVLAYFNATKFTTFFLRLEGLELEVTHSKQKTIADLKKMLQIESFVQ